jgi:hypothetical protein
VDGYNVVVVKFSPGTDSTEPNEDGDVEEHVDGRLKGVVLKVGL